MERREGAKTPEIEVKYLEPKKAAQLFLMSFRFSQGLPELQKTIFKYIHSKYPHYKIREQDEGDIITLTANLANKYIHHGKARHTKEQGYDDGVPNTPINIGEIKHEINIVMGLLFEIFNGDSINEDTTQEIAEMSIKRDYQYLHGKLGRPGRSHNDTANKFMSFVCEYCINHKSTGSEEYDTMWRDIYDTLMTKIKSGQLGIQLTHELETVINVHNEHHPLDLISLELTPE